MDRILIKKICIGEERNAEECDLTDFVINGYR